MRNQAREWMIWFKKQTGVDGYRLDAIKHFPAGITEDNFMEFAEQRWFCLRYRSNVCRWRMGWRSIGTGCLGGLPSREEPEHLTLGYVDLPELQEFMEWFMDWEITTCLTSLELSKIAGTEPQPLSTTTTPLGLHSQIRQARVYRQMGNYPVDAQGNPKGWSSNSELSPNIDPREPRLTAAYAIIMSMDGHPTVFFEDLFDVGTTGKRYTHLPQSETDLPIRQSIANLIRCHRKFDFKSGDYRVRTSEPSVFFDGSNAGDLIVFERSAKAIIAVTDNFNNDQAAWVDCDFAVGTVLKDYTGNFPNVTVTTRQSGPGEGFG
jgi:alpha-amylase